MREAVNLLEFLTVMLRAGTGIMFLFCVPKAIHIFQQESYQFRDYFRWITKNPKKAFGEGMFELACTLVFFTLMVLMDIYITRFNFAVFVNQRSVENKINYIFSSVDMFIYCFLCGCYKACCKMET